MESGSPTTQFNALIEGLESRMIRAIARILDDPDDAEDALQNVLTTIWQKGARHIRVAWYKIPLEGQETI